MTQPWATLVAFGAKRVETRSWSTSHRGPLAIHAAKGFPMEAQRLCWESEEFREALAKGFGHYPLDEPVGNLTGYPLPRGAVVAVADLQDVIPTERVHRPGRSDWDEQVHYWADDSITIGPTERGFGDFSAGRFAWVLTNVRPLRSPVDVRGALGLWDWQPPTRVLSEVGA